MLAFAASEPAFIAALKLSKNPISNLLNSLDNSKDYNICFLYVFVAHAVFIT